MVFFFFLLRRPPRPPRFPSSPLFRSGINPPSLYAAFGSKRNLFLAAIDRYAATLGSRPFGAFCLEPDARKAVANLFESSIRCATEKGKPRGCLIASVATVEATKDSDVRSKLADIFTRTDQAIAEHLQEAQKNNQTPAIEIGRASGRERV